MHKNTEKNVNIFTIFTGLQSYFMVLLMIVTSGRIDMADEANMQKWREFVNSTG